MRNTPIDLLKDFHIFCREGKWIGFHQGSNRIFELTTEEATLLQQLSLFPENELPEASSLLDELTAILGESRPSIHKMESINTFYLRLNRRCNLRCDYCRAIPKQNEPNDDRVLNPKMASLAASVMWSLGAKGVGLHGGEPFADWKNTFAVLMAIRNSTPEMAIGITCNGTLVTEEIARSLKRLNVLVSVEIDGSQRLHDQFKKYSNGASSYSDALAGAKLLRDYDLLAAIESTVSGVDGYDNEGYQSLRALFPGIPIIVARVKDRSSMPWVCHNDDLEHFLKQQIECIEQSDAIMNDAVAGLVNLSSLPIISAYRCVCLLDKVSIDMDGSVYICPKEESIRTFIGRITDKDFAKDFYKRRLQTARQFASTPLTPVWYSCLTEYCLDSTYANEMGQDQLQDEDVLGHFYEDLIYIMSQRDWSSLTDRWGDSGF